MTKPVQLLFGQGAPGSQGTHQYLAVCEVIK